jgi:hypothetical protein
MNKNKKYKKNNMSFYRIKIDKIKLNHNNRMIRIGFGKHDGNWFFRIDFWFIGYRFKI